MTRRVLRCMQRVCEFGMVGALFGGALAPGGAGDRVGGILGAVFGVCSLWRTTERTG